jgi:hypothetical protein
VASVGYEIGMATLKFFYISVGSIGMVIFMGLLFSVVFARPAST